ncbi:putative pentatricopeptide repeat-containing protein At5g40405 [Aristolochia californica]|uniref:putative pentatricopeptide repeat-containing protein At5g40405 n=1 Tax=Aristolochia californica TaxID=171875 RepID=UPI0035DEE62F
MQTHCVGLDEVTYLGLFSAYAHGVLVKNVWKFDEHGLVPKTENYACRVVVLSRVRQLHEALELSDQFTPNSFNKPKMWTSMIARYAQHRPPEEAIGFFKKMMTAGVKLDGVAVISVLSTCAKLKDLDIGLWIHDLVHRDNIPMSSKLVVTLVDMYAKYREIKVAHSIFDGRYQQVLPAWNALISGYCKLGKLTSACSIFDQRDKNNILISALC